MAERRTPRTQARGNLLFTPVVPDFSGIGENIDQIANQLYQYRREREIRKQQRYDMMMRQYMEMTDVQRPETVLANIQKKVDKEYNNLQGKLASIIDEDEISWGDMQEGRGMISAYHGKINEYLSWGKQWERDYKMIQDDPENWSDKTIKGIFSYTGNVSPQEAYTLRKKTPPAYKIVDKMRKAVKEGGYETAMVFNMNSNEILKAVKEGENYWWGWDDETGEPIRKPTQDRRILSVAGSSKIYQRSFLKDMQEKQLVDKEKGIYQVGDQYYSIEEGEYNGRTVKNIDDYIIDLYRGRVFPINKKITGKAVDKEEEERGELTQAEEEKIIYWGEGKSTKDVPKEIGTKKIYRAGKKGAYHTETKKFKVHPMPNRHITFDGNQLNNAHIKEGENKWRKEEEVTYDDNIFTGIVVDVEEEKIYGKFRVKLAGELKKTSGGKQIYTYINYNKGGMEVEGTIDEVIENTYLKTEAEVKNAMEISGSAVYETKTDEKYTDVIVPVEDNPEIKKFYNFKNKPDFGEKPIDKQESDDNFSVEIGM